MADMQVNTGGGIQIGALPEIVSVANTDVVPIETSAGTKKVNMENLLGGCKGGNVVTEATPLFVPSWDGSNDALHPSVVYLNADEMIDGFQYWMAFTPLPDSKAPYTDRWECPCIVASYNGIDWQVPTGLINPIDNLTDAEIAKKGYLSDPSLVYNKTAKRLELYYRLSTDATSETILNNTTVLYRKTSLDGLTWSARELVYDHFNATNKLLCNSTIRSPQILWDNGVYRMYYQSDIAGKREVCYAESDTGIFTTFRNNTKCNILNLPSDKYMPWHIGVCKHLGKYVLLGYEGNIGTKQVLAYTSNDGINFNYECVVVGYNNATNAVSFYQSYPLSCNNNLLIYATVKFDTISRRKRTQRNTICLFKGTDLNSYRNTNGNYNRNKVSISNDIILGNNADSDDDYRFLLYQSDDKETEYGFGFNKVDSTLYWQEKYSNRKRGITTVITTTQNPSTKPELKGQLWINTETKKMWISTDITAWADWKLLVSADYDSVLDLLTVTSNLRVNSIWNLGSVQNAQKTTYTIAPTLDVANKYRIIVNLGTPVPITNFTGGRDGQEVTLFNMLSLNITLKQGAEYSGFKFKDGVDYTLKPNSAIRFILTSGMWFEI